MVQQGDSIVGVSGRNLYAVTAGERSRNAGLDACRAVAISLVVFSHGVGYLEPLIPHVTETLKVGGFIGVELFFVLSGFLIGQMLLRAAEESRCGWLKTFYLRRLFRTLPSYVLFIGLNILLALLVVRPPVPDDLWRYMIFVQNVNSPHPSFFPEAWSLAIEELFYIGFPLLFLVFSWALGINRSTAILVTALTVIVGSLCVRGILASESASWDAEVRKVAAFRFDGLMVGVLLAWLYQAHAWILQEKAVTRSLMALLVACGIYVSLTPLEAMNASYFSKTFLFTFTSFGCAAVVFASLSLQLRSSLKSVVTLIAKISYSAYLVNLPVLIVINQFVVNDGVAGVAWFLMFHLATFATAFALYQRYEVMFYRLRDRYVPEKGRTDHPQLQLAA